MGETETMEADESQSDFPIDWDALEKEVRDWEKEYCRIPEGWSIEPMSESETEEWCSPWSWRYLVYV